MSGSIVFDSITPSNLSQKDLERIFELEQDMWARSEGLGEYVRCNNCEITFGKQDIYDKRDKSQYSLTVSEIEGEQGCIPVCPNCNGVLDHIFPRREYIEEIKMRYAGEAHMVIMKEDREIVGFMDGHLSGFDEIFDRDFSYRYTLQNKAEISDAIEDILGYIPDVMFSCSSMGTTENYMFFHNIYSLLQSFFTNFPVEYEGDTGISELDIGGSLERLYTSLGAKNIDMSNISPATNSGSYKSGIFIQKQLGQIYKRGFSKDLRTFLRERAI